MNPPDGDAKLHRELNAGHTIARLICRWWGESGKLYREHWELWCPEHPYGPITSADTLQLLQDRTEKKPDVLGCKIRMPFSFPCQKPYTSIYRRI